MASTSDIRNGLCIEFNNGLYIITEFLHVKPGKGPAFVRTKMRNVVTGRVLDNTFSAGHKITTVRVERRPYQYLYQDDNSFHFMHKDTYEQTFVAAEMIERSEFLKEGMIVEMMVHAETEEILTCEVPGYVELLVTYSEPGVKGDTATNATKPATLETGAEIQVPLFIGEGDLIKINTAERSYMERIRNK